MSGPRLLHEGAQSPALIPGTIVPSSKADLIRFLGALRLDFEEHREAWENWILDAYLSSAAAWMADREASLKQQGEPVAVAPDWQAVAEFFLAPRFYE